MTSTDKNILRIALPAIVSNITVPLLGLVDVTITGHLGSVAYIGAIALGGMIFNVMYWIFAFLRMGTSGLTAQALGGRRLDEVVLLLARSLAVASFIALALVALQCPLRELALFVMQPSVEVRSFATTYFNVCIWGALPTLSLFALNGWFVGMQDTRSPMLVAITQNVMNIVASLTFVFLLGMRVEGIALGTLVAQWIGFLLAVALCLRGYFTERHARHNVVGFSLARVVNDRSFTGFFRERLLRLSDYRRFFEVNRDLFLRTLCMVCVMLFFTAAGSWQGELTLAANTLLMQFFMMQSYVMDGMANAGEALCGRHFGADNRTAFRLTVNRLFRMGFLIAAIITVVYVLFGHALLRILSDEPSVVSAAGRYLPWAWSIPLAGTAAFLWDGVFIGLTAGRRMMQAMAAASVTFFVLYFLLREPLGNHGLWTAFMAYMLTRGGVQTLFYFTGKLPFKEVK